MSCSSSFPERRRTIRVSLSFGHELRACLRCRLVKTYDQFRDACENCPFFKMEEDHERIVEVTTPNFNGIISVMDPSRSWAARWLRIGKFAPGCYSLAVSKPLTEEMQHLCQDACEANPSRQRPNTYIIRKVVRQQVSEDRAKSFQFSNLSEKKIIS